MTKLEQMEKTKYRFTVPLAPVAQMRARHAVMNKKSNETKKFFTVVYKHKKQAEREQDLNALLLKFAPVLPIEGEIMLCVMAYLPIPKSMPRKQREAALSGLLRPTTKPDLDNLIKHIKDCMTKVGFWKDDKQVVEYLAGTGKYYSDNPRWEIEIEANPCQ